MQLSKRAKIWIGIATAWVVVYPFLFIFLALLSMFLGVLFALISDQGLLVGFYALVPLHLLTLILWPVLIGFYLIYITRNHIRVSVGPILLGVGLLLFPYIVMPLCYLLYVWPAQPPNVQPAYREANEVDHIETSAPGEAIEFRPSAVRFVLSGTSLFAALLIVTIPCYSVELGGLDSFAFVIRLLALIMLGAAVSILIYAYLRPRLTITITQQQVYGAVSMLHRNLIALPINDVDVSKSRQHAVKQAFVDNYYIESINDQRIRVNQFIYTKQQFQQMLDAIDRLRTSESTA